MVLAVAVESYRGRSVVVLDQIDALHPHEQAILLKTIDTFLRGAAK